MRLRLPAIGLAAVLLAGCASSGSVHVAPGLASRIEAADTTAADAEETFRVLLVGDAGAPDREDGAALLALLRAHAQAAGPNSATVFLGDNLYPDGLPPEGDPDRAQAEARLQAQIDAVADAPGRAVFVPGNHDWNHSKRGGRARLLEQEAFVEAALGEGSFLPSDGFPGPVKVGLTDDLTLLAIDTEWWLSVHERGEGRDDESGTIVGRDEDFLVQLAEAVEDARDERVLVVGHHPILSEGKHSGVVPLNRHLFPLLAAHPKAYVPLPFLGSVYVAVKQFQGEDAQDLGHPRYQALAGALAPILASHEELVYAAGHDHSLQYLEQSFGRAGTVRQIVSGAGSEGGPVVAQDALFAAGRQGFVVVRYFSDGSATFEAVAPDGSAAGQSLVAAPLLPARRGGVPPVGGPAPALADSATAVASTRYADVGWAQRAFIGSGYREAWSTPVRAPLLDLDREAGGLTAIRGGGDRQSQSLWFEGADGRLYRLRSIDKAPLNPFSLGLDYGVAREIARDATSGVYPFAAIVAARLSDAAGLYHTNPRVVVVPDDPRLGRYRDALAGTLMWYEEHPGGSGEGQPHFGDAPDLVGGSKLRRELDGDPDHRVDAPFYLRARLLDMLLADWDRHIDQWRWAAFEPVDLDPSLTGDAATQGKVYRPVARDRDFALGDRNGIVFRLAEPWLPKLSSLRPEYVNVDGLTNSGRHQDRRFLAPLDREAWLREAQSLQAALSDDAIDAALAALPPEAAAADADRLRRALVGRRDRLADAALTYYDLISDVVDVVGSQDGDVVEIDWLADGTARIVVSKRKNKGGTGLRLWERVLDPRETREVRIWARGGDDRIVVRGQRRGGLDVVILPGAGVDEVDDQTDGLGIQIFEGADEEPLTRVGPRASVDRTNRIPSAAYGYVPAREDDWLPLVIVGYNKDDGFRLGGGTEITYAGFGRRPFTRRHRLQAAVTSTTGGGFARYAGRYIDAIGRHDLGLRVHAQTPLATQNFFGYGEGTSPDAAESAFFRVRQAEVLVEPFVERALPRAIHAWAGPSFAYVRPDVDDANVLASAGLPARDLSAQTLVGLAAGLEIDAVDASVRPTQGARFRTWGRARQGLQSDGHTYARLGTSLSLYMTARALPWATLAVRGGGEHIVGTFPFYDAATVGGAATLRGYRRDRFAGRSAVFASAEPRVRLSRFRLPVVQFAEVGVLGFADAGRVWADGLETAWHAGYGGGAWLALPGATTLTLTYDASPEQTGVSFRMGFSL